MTTNWDFQNSATCDTKQYFSHQERAEKVALMMTEKYLSWIVPYRCKECGGWHLGKSLEDSERYGPVQYWLCAHCRRLIPQERRDALLNTPNVVELTCSKRCRRYMSDKRRRLRRREEKLSMTEPDTSYPAENVSLDVLEGLEKLRAKPSRMYSEEFVEVLKRTFRREEKNSFANDPLFNEAQRRFDAGELSLDQTVNYFLTERTQSKPR